MANLKSTLADPLLGFQYWPEAEFAPIRSEMKKILTGVPKSK
jgi:hypothetical protein